MATGRGGHQPATLAGYFIANQSIHLLTRIDKIDFPASDEARLQVTVGMVGREAGCRSRVGSRRRPE